MPLWNGPGAMAVIYRFLFDECLSPDLAQLAHSLGFEAFHVRDLQRLGSSDPSLALLAIERDSVFVTNNRIDFSQIYRKLELHPGLVIILPSTGVPTQERLFATFIEALPGLGDITNMLIEIDLSGAIVALNWPPQRPNEPAI